MSTSDLEDMLVEEAPTNAAPRKRLQKRAPMMDDDSMMDDEIPTPAPIEKRPREKAKTTPTTDKGSKARMPVPAIISLAYDNPLHPSSLRPRPSHHSPHLEQHRATVPATD